VVCFFAAVIQPLRGVRGCRAQSLVEMALLMPVLTLLLFGVADLGRAFFYSIALHEAAQAGALVAVEWQHRTDCADLANPCSIPPCSALSAIACANAQVLAAIKNSAPSVMSITDADIALTPAGEWSTVSGWNAGAAYTVKVNYTFHFVTPLVTRSTTLPLSASVSGNRNP